MTRASIADLRALRALNWPFIITFLVLWNVGGALAFFFGAPTTSLGLFIGGATALLASFVALAIVSSSAFRKLVIHPARREHYHPGSFLFIAVVAAALGLIWLVGSLASG